MGTPAASNVRRAGYPQILPDGRAIFRVNAPDAQNIQLDLAKKYDMVKNSDGVWEVTTDSLTEGFHYYSLIIDGLQLLILQVRHFTVWAGWQVVLRFLSKEMIIMR